MSIIPSDLPSAKYNLGSNHIAVREYNERTIVRVIRKNGPQSKSDIAKVTNLSVQTVSSIIDSMIRRKLLIKREKLKGKIGQPSIPIDVNPNGVYSIGVSINRSITEIMLLDFNSNILSEHSVRYEYPNPTVLYPFIVEKIRELIEILPEKQRKKIAGIGMAAPLEVDSWQEFSSAPSGLMASWQDLNITAKLQEEFKMHVITAKDTVAAALAESELGLGNEWNYFFYFFIGRFIGGGLVLNGFLNPGRTGNSGAIGSLPIPYLPIQDSGLYPQLIDVASKFILEKKIRKSIHENEGVIEQLRSYSDEVEEWVDASAKALAYSITVVNCVHDFEGVVIDGSIPKFMLESLLDKVNSYLKSYDYTGISKFDIKVGGVGHRARGLGAALMPQYASFAADPGILLKNRSSDNYLDKRFLRRSMVQIYNAELK